MRGAVRAALHTSYEAFGAERLYSEAGHFNGGYDWHDLDKLVERCAR